MEANGFKSPYKYLLDLCEMLETADTEHGGRESNIDMDFEDLLAEFYVLVHNTVDGNGVSRKRKKSNYKDNEKKIRCKNKPLIHLTTEQPFAVPTTSSYNGIQSRRKISIMDYDFIRQKTLRTGSNLNTYRMTSVAEAEEIEAVELFFNSIKDTLRAVIDEDNVLFKTL